MFRKKLKNLDELSLIFNPNLDELPNSIRFVKQAIIYGNNEMREDNPDNMEVSQDCDQIDAMVQAACDRVWESRQILLTARPQPKSKNEDEGIVNHCHEVLFSGSEEHQKSIMKLILQYLIKIRKRCK